ncbi:MAG TPA: hypothetical protein VFD39_00925 [Trueperaceae bacterium]|nr:hypothetical protein [Trueperaceae bacterium]
MTAAGGSDGGAASGDSDRGAATDGRARRATAERIGYHASHEQFAPGHLLDLVRRAERAGFGAAMCSDHFHPWSERQGNAGFAWSWLGSARSAAAS